MKVIGFRPYKKQLEVINSIINGPEKYYTICTGRQTGKSLIIENLIYYFLFNYPGTVNAVISPTYKQVKKIYTSIKEKLNTTDVVVSDNKSDLEIIINNGSKVQFFSAENYDSIRGNTFTGITLLDEAAFMREEAWSTAIKATTLVKCKKVCFFSTPYGKNYFFSLYQLGFTDAKYKSFNFSSYENPFIDRAELEEYKRSLPESIYRQEILGEFIDDDSDVFRNVNEVCTLAKNNITNGRYFIGVDVGNVNDYTVISRFNDKGEQMDLYRFQKSDWNLLSEEIAKYIKQFPNSITYIEQNGVGNPILDAVKKLIPGSKVKGWITSNDSKQEIINNLIYAMDKLEIKLINDPVLKAEFNTFTYKFNKSSGKIFYGHRAGFHDDCIMSTAIGYKNYLENKVNQGRYIVDIIR